MNVDEIVTLLEQHWSELPDRLGGDWDAFLDDYTALVEELGDNPSPSELESVTDSICRLLHGYDPTRQVLADAIRQPPEVTRRAASAKDTLPEETTVRLIHNRMQALAGRAERRATREEQRGEKRDERAQRTGR